MQNTLHEIVTAYITGSMKLDFPEFSTLVEYLKVDISESNKVSISFVSDKPIILSEDSKLEHIRATYAYLLKEQVLSEAHNFEVVIGPELPEKENTKCKFQFSNLINELKNGFLIERFEMFERRFIGRFDFMMSLFKKNANQLIKKVLSYSECHGQTKVIKKNSIGRCSLVISKQYRHFCLSDWPSEKRLQKALQHIINDYSECFTGIFELHWEGECISSISMEGYLLEIGKNPMEILGKSLRLMAKEVMFMSRFRLEQSGAVHSHEIKQEMKLYKGMNLN